jgi:hypothetical protein
MYTRTLLALLGAAALSSCGAAARAPAAVTPRAAPTATAAPAIALGATPRAPRATALPAAPATPAASAAPAAPARAGSVGQPFELALGEERPIAGAGLTLRLEAVTEDSRCPADAQCIWAGRAVVAIEARAGAGAPETLTLGLPGGITPDAPELRPAGAHTVRLLSLDPYPATSGGPPLPYVATLLVEPR